MEWRKSRVPPSSCPYCKEVMDGASTMMGGVPKPGDISVCIHCASLLQFDQDIRLVIVTHDEWEAIKAEDPVFAKLTELHQRSVKMFGSRNRPSKRR